MVYHSDEYRSEITLPKIPQRVIGGNILVRVDPEEYIRVKGLILGDIESIHTEKKRFNPSNHAIRHGVVTLCNTGAKAENDMFTSEVDVVAGDMVWFDYMTGINATLFCIDNTYYYMFHYTDLICRKRNDEIYPLNGYILCDLYEDAMPFLPDKVVIPQKAVVKYVGQDVEYKYRSGANVNVGDVVLTNSPIYMLEDDLHLFLDGSKYRVLKRSQIDAVCLP